MDVGKTQLMERTEGKEEEMAENELLLYKTARKSRSVDGGG